MKNPLQEGELRRTLSGCVATVLHQRRVEAGLSLEQISKLLGPYATTQLVRHMEFGSSAITVDYLAAVSSALRVHPAMVIADAVHLQGGSEYPQ